MLGPVTNIPKIMNWSRWIFCLVLVFFSFCYAVAQTESAAKAGVGSSIFQALKAGQKVSLKESFGFWEVSVLNNGDIGVNTILEITPNYLVVNDPLQVTKSWIPIGSVHRVTVMKVPTSAGQSSKP